MGDAAAVGGDVSGYLQVGGLIGAIIGGVIFTIWGRRGEASAAISQTRAEATDVFTKETQANREVLQAIKQAEESTRDAAIAIRDGISAMREQNNRIVTCQEAIVRIMQDQAEDQKFVERTARLMGQLSERERVAERERVEDRHRPTHR